MRPSPSPTVDIACAERWLAPLTDIVIRAGLAILAIARHDIKATDKSDGSPVTKADLVADAVIAAGLATLAPHVLSLSEERLHPAREPIRDAFFLIDPLDGTKEFIAGLDEYTVNLALVVAGVPLLGIVGAPAQNRLWRGIAGRGCERLSLTSSGGIAASDPVSTRIGHPKAAPRTFAVSRSHGDQRTDAFIAATPEPVRRKLGSSLKLCAVAQGDVDIYPRLAPIREWDIAAGHALVTAAGGRVTDGRGQPIHFGIGRAEFVIPEFIAWGDPADIRPVD